MLSCVNSLYVADEIRVLIDNGKLRDKRLEMLLESLVKDNEMLYTVNTMALKLCDSELSEVDMLKHINLYRAYRGKYDCNLPD